MNFGIEAGHDPDKGLYVLSFKGAVLLTRQKEEEKNLHYSTRGSSVNIRAPFQAAVLCQCEEGR